MYRQARTGRGLSEPKSGNSESVEEKLQRMERSRLAKECAKLDPAFEKAMAEEGMSEEIRIKILT